MDFDLVQAKNGSPSAEKPLRTFWSVRGTVAVDGKRFLQPEQLRTATVKHTLQVAYPFSPRGEGRRVKRR
jgi:hypothetical protein